LIREKACRGPKISAFPVGGETLSSPPAWADNSLSRSKPCTKFGTAPSELDGAAVNIGQRMTKKSNNSAELMN
jgi:hypothetical protein